MRSLPSAAMLQRGSTLIVAIVLLLVLSLVGFFAVNVGVSEQRTSGAEVRARIVRQVAESALSHTFEYARMSRMIPTQPGGEVDLTVWEPCLANDQTFPCGAVPAARRASMFRYRGGVDFDEDGTIDAMERYMVDMPPIAGGAETQALATVGNFDVRYGVGAVLCTLDDARACTTVDEERTGLATVTLVAVAEIPEENARGTLVQTYGSFNVFSFPPSAPTLTAGGIMQGVGNATIVANPNSGGVGVPVSIWTRAPMDVNNGSWQTCQLDEYMRSGAPGYSSSGVMICDDCNCLGADKMSKGQGQGGPVIGLDLQTPQDATNLSYFGDTIPSQYFPCDMFEFVFGVRAREDDDDGDGVRDPDANGDGIVDADSGLPYGVCETGKDEDGDGNNDVMVDYLEGIEATELTSCAGLDATAVGMYWIRENQCDLAGQIGTPETPVVIVSEKGFRLQQAEVYGVLFGVDPTMVNIDQSNLGGLRPTFEAGGGKSKIYGAFLVEGGGKVNANLDLIPSPKVIENLNDSDDFRRFGAVPGSWTDQYAF